MGNKYGRQRRAQQRREEAAQQEMHADAQLWEPDPDEPRFVQTVQNDTEVLRVTQRTVRYEQSNILVEFAVVVSRRNGDGWDELLCIDTRHRPSVHRHRNGDHSSEPEHIRNIYSPSDVQIGLSDAIEEAYDLVYDEER